MFSFKAVHCRLHWGKCGTCWRTYVWFSSVETVAGWPYFPCCWHSTPPEWRNFVMTHSMTVLLGGVLLNLSEFCYRFQTWSPFTTASIWAEIILRRDSFPAITALHIFHFSTGNMYAGAMPHRQTYMYVRDVRVSVLYYHILYLQKICSSNNLSKTNPTWPSLGLNTGHCSGKPNHVSYVTA